MYLWNINKLTHELKNDLVSEKEKFKYLFVGSAIWIFLGNIGAFLNVNLQNKTLESYTQVYILLFIGIILSALILMYKKNAQGDNQKFIERYTCISFPAYVQGTVYFLLAIVIYFVLGTIFLSGNEFISFTKSSMYARLISWIIIITFYGLFPNILMYRSIQRISKKAMGNEVKV